MKSRRKFGHEGSTEYCSGFTDRHGHWNNGFHCPKWGNPSDEYCCGTDQLRFCCPRVSDNKESANTFSKHQVTILVGIFLSLVIVASLVLLGSCYFCRCCLFSKRRKHRCDAHHTHRETHYTRGYSICANNHCHHGSIPLATRAAYPPSDSPPPYPGALDSEPEEKVPLRETQFVNTDPGESPIRFTGESPPRFTGESPPRFTGESPQGFPIASAPSVGSVQNSPLTTNNSSIGITMVPNSPWEYKNSIKNHAQCSLRSPGDAMRSPGDDVSSRPAQDLPLYSTAHAQPSSSRTPSDRLVVTPGAVENTSSSPTADAPFQKGNPQESVIPALSDQNLRQNSSNEDRLLYNMVLVGVEPDLTSGVSRNTTV